MKIGINQKLLGSFLAGTVFSFIFIGWSLIAIGRLVVVMVESETINRRVESTYHLSFQMQKLLKIAGDYLISGNVLERDTFDVLITEISKNIEFLDKENGDKRWEEMSGRIRDKVRRLSEMTVDIMFIDNPIGNARAARLMRDASILGEDLTEDLDRFSRILEAERHEIAESTANRAKRTRAILYVFPPVGAILLVLLYLYLRYYITRPIFELFNEAERISKGDFGHKVSINTKDELEELAGGFNRMAEAVKEREIKLTSLLKVIDKINQELIISTQHKMTFLSNVSHELKTPLTHIMGFTELLRLEAKDKLSDSAKRHLDNIHMSGKTLLKLIEDLLDVTKTSGGVILGEMKDVDVKKVADEAIGVLMPRIEKKGLSFMVYIDTNIKPIKADEGMLKQIFLNLVDNAVKFTPSGGKVELRVSEGFEKEKRVVRVGVSDTGIGIAKELKETIFNPFETGDKTITREYGGLGIGLVLAKRFIEFHGGRIWFESEPGKGTTFEFFIPSGTIEKVE